MRNPVPAGTSGTHISGTLFALDQNTSHLTLSPNKSFANLTIGSDIEIQGNLKTTGTITQSSSHKLRRVIESLSMQEAINTLRALEPVKFSYANDHDGKLHAGFVAEEAPELVATSDRTALAPLDIVAVLTRVVQDQQRAIAVLRNQLEVLARPGAQAAP
jgi:hypothetical protein